MSEGEQDQADRYRRHRARAGQAQAEQSRQGRDIGELPPIADTVRRLAASRSFRAHCETYHAERFGLAWSPDHLVAIQRIEDAVLNGGLFALAMPRGSGKTTLCEIAAEWAVLHGHRRFIALVGPTMEHAVGNLENVRIELETNELLLEDFPEVCHPIRLLERTPQRKLLYHGHLIYTEWHAKEITLPTIPESPASGAIVCARGLLGKIRGMKRTTAGGESVRPDLAIIDDPQTEASAASAVQCAKRMNVLTGAILGLAGPGKRIAGIMPCTVIAPGDLADQILDREKFPQWQGLRTKLVYEWPTNEELWREYGRIRAESLRAGHGGREATEFYRQHRQARDAGAKVGWEDRYAPDELSAIQHAWNLRFDMGEAAFFAEFQNDPIRLSTGPGMATVDQVMARVNGRPRGQVPLECEKLTAFVDIHDRLLYWMAVAWQPGMTGFVLDYGAFPDPGVPTFHLSDARVTLRRQFPGKGIDGAILAGLEALILPLVNRDWSKAGGSTARLDKVLVDMGYKRKLAAAVKHKVGGTTIELAKGLGITAGRKPIADYVRKPGEVYGDHWYKPAPKGAQEFPHVAHDANHWKSWVHERLLIAAGDPGALTLFGRAPSDHKLLAQHLSESETYTETFGQGRTVREWKLKPDKPDNHWFDCLVGCAVAASLCGLRPAGEPEKPKRPRLKLSDIQRRKRELGQ